MIVFLALVALLLALAFLLLFFPYWRRRGGAVPAADRRQLNAAVYRDQIAELDRDRAAGALSESDHQEARDELQRRLLEDSTPAASTVIAPAASPKKTVLALVALLPLAAFGLYLLLGNPTGLNPPPRDRQFTQADIERMVGVLAARLEEHPENQEGWVMLGRAYRVLHRFDEAERAFARADKLMENDATLLAEYADVIIARTGSFSGKPAELLARALKADPNNVQALWLAGTAQFEAGRYAQAAATWERARKLLPPDSEDAQALAASIEEARAKSGARSGKPRP